MKTTMTYDHFLLSKRQIITSIRENVEKREHLQIID